jgi:hypothetical protein
MQELADDAGELHGSASLQNFTRGSTTA